MKSPKLVRFEREGTHRLIPYRYSDRGRSILNLLAENDEDLLKDLTELEGATNDRLLGESGRLSGISTVELVSGFHLAHIINASFAHANPSGGRFNSPTRGAWYAAFEMETAQKEVAFHRAMDLKEIGWTVEEISPYIDYLADFRYQFHDIRDDPDFSDCLDPSPGSYSVSQALGQQLLAMGSAGIVYPSVRHKDGVCVVCFRPPLVLNVREGGKVTFTFTNMDLSAITLGD
jgi:RES domain-containing protein